MLQLADNWSHAPLGMAHETKEMEAFNFFGASLTNLPFSSFFVSFFLVSFFTTVHTSSREKVAEISSSLSTGSKRVGGAPNLVLTIRPLRRRSPCSRELHFSSTRHAFAAQTPRPILALPVALTHCHGSELATADREKEEAEE